MSAPLLSVLIPAYHYAAGVERIPAPRGQATSRAEYIVQDGPSDDAVAANCGNDMLHRRSGGWENTIAIWNGLLERARGTFAVLVHRDEVPSGAGLFEEAVQLPAKVKQALWLCAQLLGALCLGGRHGG